MTPDRLAILHEDTAYTHGDLHRRATRLANALHELGVRPGDRVAYLGPNHPTYLETLFACGMLAALFVPINTRLNTPEIAHILQDSGAHVLIHDDRPQLDDLSASDPPLRIALPNASSSQVAPQDRQHSSTDTATGHEYAALLDSAGADPVDREVTLSDPCLIMYTSGTTGQPKGAVLTHGNLTWNCVNALVESEWSRHDRALVAAPLFHIAALGMITLPALLKGAAVHLDTFDASRALATLHNGRTTVMFGVPTMFRRMAEHPEFADTDLSAVRALLCGGSPIPPDLVAAYAERGPTFAQGYGMTETSPGVLFGDPDSDPSASAGVPSFFTDIRVVTDDGRPVTPGERGELQISGRNVMAGYWNGPKATGNSFRDGWFRSGDVATVDGDGRTHVVDRIKDIIISGGENIYPAEIEQALEEHPEVRSCAVIGVPDPRWGEVGRAVVVPFHPQWSDDAALLVFLRERLAGYKVPKRIEFTDELPLSGAGKLLKPRIRELFGE